MKMNPGWVTVLLLLPGAQGLCGFNGLTASCNITLGGMPVVAAARVNPCHSPVDITFQVEGMGESNISWRYTYVTTNPPENAAVSPHIRLAMTASKVDRLGRIRVEARFLLDGSGSEELQFVNQQIRIPHTQENCVPLDYGAGAGWIAGACLLGLGLATLVVGGVLVKGRTRRSNSGGGSVGIRRRFLPTLRGNNTGGTVVQYVVPAETTTDLKVYVSTTAGLQQVESTNKPAVQQTTVQDKPNKSGLTETDLRVGISNEGFVSEDEDHDQRQEDQDHDEQHLDHGDNNNFPKLNQNGSCTEAAATGAIPKRRLEL